MTVLLWAVFAAAVVVGYASAAYITAMIVFDDWCHDEVDAVIAGVVWPITAPTLLLIHLWQSWSR